MVVILKREMKRIKGGWCSRSEAFHLAAHGFNQDAADRNLERIVRLFLAPLKREGLIDDKIKGCLLRYSGDEAELDVSVAD